MLITASPQHCSGTSASSQRGGYSLVELLVASTIGLALMAFIATVFGVIGQASSEGQDIARMQDQLRAAAWTLRQDLMGATSSQIPWQRPEQGAGYFELIEGPLNDSGTGAVVGDVDDVLMFTTQKLSGTFSTKVGAESVESPIAEVIWFCGQPVEDARLPGVTLYKLHRRCLVVRPYLGFRPEPTVGNDVFAVIDTSAGQFPNGGPQGISMRAGAAPTQFVLNGLADLTKRENRFLHTEPVVSGTSTFPFEVDLVELRQAILASGDDIVMTNVIGFDVRVFDAQQSPNAFIDLGNAGSSATTTLSGTANHVAKNIPLAQPTYCTWSYHYEFNGIDEDDFLGPDQGTNGIDDNGDGVPDDIGELETSPPYSVPLRAVEVRLRCIEPQSKQIRQVTIRHTFPR